MTMLGSLLFTICFVLAHGQLQRCANGGMGPCIGNSCLSTTATCITTVDGRVCCENSMIIGTATTNTGTCVDRLNPRTGVSDCPRNSNLCNNAVYYQLMTEQCPKTCNRCQGTPTTTSSTTPTCRDLVNPATGVSDCTRMANYCTRALYVTLMKEQCPKTCRYCV